jgi:hypothetical protein
MGKQRGARIACASCIRGTHRLKGAVRGLDRRRSPTASTCWLLLPFQPQPTKRIPASYLATLGQTATVLNSRFVTTLSVFITPEQPR